jgi:hypothetical protein
MAFDYVDAYRGLMGYDAMRIVSNWSSIAIEPASTIVK